MEVASRCLGAIRRMPRGFFRRVARLAAGSAVTAAFCLVTVPGALAEDWPTWRGPRLDGTSAETSVPVHWSATSNVVWKSELPGAGHASPIVWGDRLFTVAALADQQSRVLLCLDRKTGGILWRQTVVTAPMERKHSLNSHASSTPATDGEQV